MLNKCRLAALNRRWSTKVNGAGKRPTARTLRRWTPGLPTSSHRAICFRRVVFLTLELVAPSCNLLTGLLTARYPAKYGGAQGGRAISHYGRTVAQSLVFISGKHLNPMETLGKFIELARVLHQNIAYEVDTKVNRPEIELMWEVERPRLIREKLRSQLKAELEKLWPQGELYRSVNGSRLGMNKRRAQTIRCANNNCTRVFAKRGEAQRHFQSDHVPRAIDPTREVKCPWRDCFKAFKPSKDNGRLWYHLKHFHIKAPFKIKL